MMLNTDLCLAFDGRAQLFQFERGNYDPMPLDASTNECCAWLSPEKLGEVKANSKNREWCGVTDFPKPPRPRQRALCCHGHRKHHDCGNIKNPQGKAVGAIKSFASDESTWIPAFVKAWQTATANGFALRHLSSCPETGSP